MSQRESFNVVAYGEVLWDLLPDQAVLGGAPFNFAFRVNSLGQRACIVSSVGMDELGDKALDQVLALGMSVEYIQRNNRYPTGTVEVFLDEDKQPDYKIITAVAYDHIRLSDSILSLVGSADCLCFGTLALRNSESRKTLKSLVAAFNGRFRLYDINLRKNCYNRSLIQSSLEHTDILKLNDGEAREINELLQLRAESLPGIGHAIIRQYPVRICLITCGPNGVLAVSSKDEVVYEPGYRISLKDPLGAGDAFSAGFLSRLLSGSGLREACRFGNQVGAIAATQAGATQLIDRKAFKEISKMYGENVQTDLQDFINT
jgi:fructokinase